MKREYQYNRDISKNKIRLLSHPDGIINVADTQSNYCRMGWSPENILSRLETTRRSGSMEHFPGEFASSQINLLMFSYVHSAR